MAGVAGSRFGTWFRAGFFISGGSSYFPQISQQGAPTEPVGHGSEEEVAEAGEAFDVVEVEAEQFVGQEVGGDVGAVHPEENDEDFEHAGEELDDPPFGGVGMVAQGEPFVQNVAIGGIEVGIEGADEENHFQAAVEGGEEVSDEVSLELHGLEEDVEKVEELPHGQEGVLEVGEAQAVGGVHPQLHGEEEQRPDGQGEVDGQVEPFGVGDVEALDDEDFVQQHQGEAEMEAGEEQVGHAVAGAAQEGEGDGGQAEQQASEKDQQGEGVEDATWFEHRGGA